MATYPVTPQRAGQRHVVLASVLAAAALCPLLAVTASRFSPLMVMAGLAGLAVVTLAILRPSVALLLGALVVPLERVGRLTDDLSQKPLSVMRIIGALMLASMVVHWALYRRAIRFPRPFVFYAIYTTFAVTSLLWTTDTTYSPKQAVFLAGNVAFVLVTVNFTRSERQMRQVLGLWLVVTTAVGLYTIYQWHRPSGIVDSLDFYYGKSGLTTGQRFQAVIYDGPADAAERPKRAIGTTSHPAVYGINVLVSIPFFFAFLETTRNRKLQVLILGGALVAIYNVFLTNTRAAVISFGVVIALCFAWKLIRLSFRQLLLVGAAMVLALVFAPQDVYSRAFSVDRWFSTDQSHSFGSRLVIWNTALEMISERWLTGYGVGNQDALNARFGKVNDDMVRSTHMDLLGTTFETGLIGLAAMAAFVITLYRGYSRLERSAMAAGDAGRRALVLAAKIQLWCVLVEGLQMEAISFTLKGFWLTAGVMMAQLYFMENRTPRETTSASQKS